jgi:hypothetical protein
VQERLQGLIGASLRLHHCVHYRMAINYYNYYAQIKFLFTVIQPFSFLYVPHFSKFRANYFFFYLFQGFAAIYIERRQVLKWARIIPPHSEWLASKPEQKKEAKKWQHYLGIEKTDDVDIILPKIWVRTTSLGQIVKLCIIKNECIHARQTDIHK